MILMSQFRRRPNLAACIALALLWATGCARPGLQSDDSIPPPDQRQVPFHDVEGTSDTQPSNSASVPDHSANQEGGLPFHDPKNLPAGTMLTVRLKTPISSQNPGSKGTFEAELDEAVVVEGNKLVPRGAIVIGRVESVRSSNVGNNRGYIRLALDSIRLGDVRLPILTSSLFVRGNSTAPQPPQGELSPQSASVVHLEKGRRLTFRLSEPAVVAASQRAPADR